MMTITLSVLAFCCLLDTFAVGISVNLGDIGISIGINEPGCKGRPVILSRSPQSSCCMTFGRNWTAYKNGFGDTFWKQFWLGNEKIHQMTATSPCTLRIEMTTIDGSFYEEYEKFSLDSEDNKYAIHLSGAVTGNAGDSLTSTTTNWNVNGVKFSTPDNSNDRSTKNNCAQKFYAGWWFNDCWMACLTCQGEDFNWYSLKDMPSKGVLLSAKMILYEK